MRACLWVGLAMLWAVSPSMHGLAQDKTGFAPRVSGKHEFQGRPYFIQFPKKQDKPALLVWCHPGDGNPEPEFKWWNQTQVLQESTILLCPKAQGNGWSPQADDAHVLALIRKIKNEHGVDPEKVALGGHSAGGHYTYLLGLQHIKEFRAFFPTAGALPYPKVDKAPANAPGFFLYHSRNDQVVPFKHAERARELLINAGYAVALTEDNAKHNIGPKLAELVSAEIKRWDAVKP
jgi:poly(3-hydroxybutyrate) depolymerase